jgi:hypothetical protein
VACEGGRILLGEGLVRNVTEVPVMSLIRLFIGFLSATQLHNEAWSETMAADYEWRLNDDDKREVWSSLQRHSPAEVGNV